MSAERDNRRWLIFWSIVLIIGTSIPYFLGFLFAHNSGFQFSGFIFGVEDGNSYIAKMLIGWSGDWLFRTPYTAYPQNGFLAFLPYVLLGKLASSNELHLQLVILFHLFRIFGIVFLVYETYKFVKIFVQSEVIARLSVLISCFGGGLGWLMIVLKGTLPLEFYSPEAFGFLSLLGLPHLLFARALMLRSFRMLFQPGRDIFNIDRKITSGVYLFIAGLFQPLVIPQTWLIFGVWKLVEVFILRKEKLLAVIKESFYFFLVPLPFFLYNVLNFLFDPYLSAWQDQNIIKSPPPIDFLWAYIIGFICVIVVIAMKVQSIEKKTFLYCWILLLPALVYLPINLQRRLSEGYWVILAIFIAVMVSKIKNKLLISLSIAGLSLTTIFLYAGTFSQLISLNPPIYQPNTMIDIFSKIDTIENEESVVLAPYEVSNVLPAYLPLKVVTGHGPESKNLKEIQPFVNEFYQNSQVANFKEFFDLFDVRYIIYPRISMKESEPIWTKNVDLIYQNDDYELFRVNKVGTP